GSIEEKIIALIDLDLRPAVAQDGGDIRFDRFADGIVYIEMQGSCNGCPSSTATLKMGIETRMREAFPEVLEVVQI
ncbi:MAG: NifU family protein, partial [Bdellovibrionota bacterium]